MVPEIGNVTALRGRAALEAMERLSQVKPLEPGDEEGNRFDDEAKECREREWNASKRLQNCRSRQES